MIHGCNSSGFVSRKFFLLENFPMLLFLNIAAAASSRSAQPPSTFSDFGYGFCRYLDAVDQHRAQRLAEAGAAVVRKLAGEFRLICFISI
jgi:hypothetical protein